MRLLIRKKIIIILILFTSIGLLLILKTNIKSNQKIQKNRIAKEYKNLEETNGKEKTSKFEIVEIENIQRIPWGVKYLKVNKLWSKTKGKGIKVAVLDSGISKHEDIEVKGEFNAINSGAIPTIPISLSFAAIMPATIVP